MARNTMIKIGAGLVALIGAVVLFSNQDFLLWLELTTFGTFVRESTSTLGYPTFIVLHTVGLAVVVGTSTIVGARVLGFAKSIPLEPMGWLFPLIWIGFAVNTFSGSGLAAATATGQFTNPIFIMKMTFVILAVTCLRWLQKRVFINPDGIKEVDSTTTKALAGAMLGFWMLAMIAGRLIAYAGVVLGR